MCADNGNKASEKVILVLATPIDTHQFHTLMSRLARAWNKQQANDVATCFAPNVIISQVIQAIIWQGHDEVQDYVKKFMAKNKTHMVWHHLLFDEESQVGSGEYSFSVDSQHRHGIVLVKIEDGKIINLRAYETPSDMGWQQFVWPNSF